MKIRKLFKIHYSYFMNKVNVIIIIICFLLIQAISIFSWIENFKINLNEFVMIENTLISIFTFLKLILVLFCIFMIGNFCLAEREEYKLFYICNDVKSIKFYFTKLLSIDFLLIVFVMLLYFMFLLIGMLFSNMFQFSLEYMKIFIILYLIGVIYGHLTIIIMKALNSSLTIFISFIIFLSVDLVDNSKMINTFFPSFDVNLMSTYNLNYFISLFIIMLFYFIISLILISGKNS